MPDKVELMVRLHPMSGEDTALTSRDFASAAEALDAISRAMDDRRSLILVHARYEGDVGESAVVVNLANVVTVRVLETDTTGTSTAGQYL
jgi:uncharacterized protein YjaG (DUF416 family)